MISLMNALECRTITSTCMHDSCVYIALLRSIDPTPVHLNMVMVYKVEVSSESVHDLGVHYRLAMSLKASVTWLPKLNYALESHCLFTLSTD